MKTLFLFIPLLTASAVHALLGQLEAATVYNATSNAPVVIAGNVTCSEMVKDSKRYSTASGELNFTNTSSRGIVALNASAIVKCSHGPARLVRYQQDALFFRAHGLASGESITKPVPSFIPPDVLAGLHQQESLSSDAASTPPRVDVEVEFVQFEDGSTWGDSGVISELPRRRKNIESLLSRLASASNAYEFDSMLRAVLSTATTDLQVYNMAYKISTLLKESGIGAARDSVNEGLRIASEREASGKF